MFVVTGLALAKVGAWARGPDDIRKLPNVAAAPAERGWPLRVIGRREPKVRLASSARESACVDERPEWGNFGQPPHGQPPAAERRFRTFENVRP